MRCRGIKWPSQRQQTAGPLLTDVQGKNTRAESLINADEHTLRSSASGFGCPSSSSLCLISSSSSFSLFLSRSSASISFSRSLRRFCSALPLGVTPKITAFRTIAWAAVLHLLQVRSGAGGIYLRSILGKSRSCFMIIHTFTDNFQCVTYFQHLQILKSSMSVANPILMAQIKLLHFF